MYVFGRLCNKAEECKLCRKTEINCHKGKTKYVPKNKGRLCTNLKTKS